MAFSKFAYASIVKPGINLDGWADIRKASAPVGAVNLRSAARVVLQEYNPKDFMLSHCFPPGHKVLMADGTEKSIERVRVGDSVITHAGNIRAVTKVLVRDVDESLIVIHAASLPDVSCTSGHPFYSIREDASWCRIFPSYHGSVKCTFGGKRVCSRNSCTTNGAVPEWVKAKDIQAGDRTYTPTLHETKIAQDLNGNRLRLLGYYISEGRVDVDGLHSRPYMIRFAIHDNEVSTLGSEIARLMRLEFGIQTHSVIKDHTSTTKGVTLSFHSFEFAPWFLKHAGLGSRTKHLSLDVITAPVSWQRQLVGSWLNGDGCYDSRGFRLATSSEDLASQAVLILDRLEIHSTNQRVAWKGVRKPGPYARIKNFDGWHVTIPKSYVEKLSEAVQWLVRGNAVNSLSTKGRYRYAASTLSTVESVSRKHYKGPVYNLSVDEDESYVVNRQAVHNCTIIASVDTEDGPGPLGKSVFNGFEVDRRFSNYYVTPQTSKFVNNNQDAWDRPLLLATYKTFIGGQSYVEHIQIPEMSKGRIIDAVARDVGDSVYIDILIANDRKHRSLISAITSGTLQTLSMGCQVTYTQCSKCGNVAEDETQFCNCIKYFKGNKFRDSLGVERVVAELCGHHTDSDSVKFIEASWVANPAFTGAVLRNVLSPDEIADIQQVGQRMQIAFSEPPRVASPDVMVRAASLIAQDQGQNPTQDEGEGGKLKPKKEDSGIDQAVNEMADLIREKAIAKARADMGQAENESLPNENLSNESLIKSALKHPNWMRIARFVLTKTKKDPEVAKKMILGMVLYRHGGWKAVESSKAFTGREVLALSRIIDIVTKRRTMAGEARIYRTALALGGLGKDADVRNYLSKARQVAGRDLTDSERQTLLVKGRLLALGS